MGQLSSALLATPHHLSKHAESIREDGGAATGWVLHGEHGALFNCFAVTGVSCVRFRWQSEPF